MDINKIRDQFPYLSNEKTKDLVYLDNAATSQKPQMVLDALTEYYVTMNANPNRGAYKLSYESTKVYEEARQKVADFIKAESKENIIFTRSTTESMNLISYSYGLENLKEGDEVLISVAEHHSNLVNWQFVCKETGATLRENGLVAFETICDISARLVANKASYKFKAERIVIDANGLGIGLVDYMIKT